MGFRFKKSKKIAPGIKMNFGKKSAGISFGGKRGGLSFNSKTGARARVSIPGTGISYSTKLGGSKKRKKASASAHSVNPRNTNTKAPSTRSTVPVPQRIWYIVLSILIVISGICYFPKGISTALLTCLVGAFMLFLTYRSKAKTPQDMEDDHEHFK